MSTNACETHDDPPYDATDTERERGAETLRELADELHEEIHDFADEAEANQADAADYYAIMQSIGSLHPALEGVAECGAALDAFEPEARAICYALEAVHHTAHARGLERDRGDVIAPRSKWNAAIRAAGAAAECAEQARDDAGDA